MSGNTTTITPERAYEELQKDNAFLLDVRLPVEYQAGHATDVDLNIPLQDLQSRVKELPTDRTILTICASGQRSLVAVKELKDLGFNQVLSIDGGTKGWRKAGLPSTVVRRFLQLDEQFRLTIGVFVLLFTLLGAFRSRKFLLGTGFIGTMLTVTAILGVCPMLNILSQMPWNKTASSQR